ncbi:MAG: class I SAM-dependent methyltransferase [Gammaproteobacteria bacterium]|nr:class I SAM-dependent methyltransferase [Gammaproteobacteria bacterium]
MSELQCDLCDGQDLEKVYKSPSDSRGLSVYICNTCSLVQSLPRIDLAPRKSPGASSGADWGNIRYGKGFRTSEMLDWFSKKCGFENINTVMDLGASRGSFLSEISRILPDAEIVAIEPDERVTKEWQDNARFQWIHQRIEDVNLEPNRFDFIYSCHTQEHLRSPRRTLRQLRAALTENGYILIEVPSINAISGADIIEEWFLDKHLYHYSPRTMEQHILSAGFTNYLVEERGENIIAYVSAKDANDELASQRLSSMLDVSETSRIKMLIRYYEDLLTANQSLLKKISQMIEDRAGTQKVVVWGGGRIFDSIVKNGGLNTKLLQGLIDKNLGNYLKDVHGCKILPPSELKILNPDVVFVLSRAFYAEIAQEISAILPEVNVIGWQQLYDEAKAM